MKKIWISSIDGKKNKVQSIMTMLKTYGLGADGHFWEDNLDTFSWIKPRKEILDQSINMWVILASNKSLQNPSIRYGLTMLTLSIQAHRGLAFPILILQTAKETINPETLTTPLRDVTILEADNPSLGAKLVTKLHTPIQKQSADYYLDIYAIDRIGQWFEVGPISQTWKGVMFGVTNADISLHAVGPKGQLPEKSTLNYPMQGLEVEVGERKFTAWAVQNELQPDTSYYIKINGNPDAVLFSQFSPEDSTEAFIINLQ